MFDVGQSLSLRSRRQVPAEDAGEFVEDAQAMREVPDMVEDTGKGCHPKCTWACEQEECESQCEPLCAAPLCQTRCPPVANPANCKQTCNKPDCMVICPAKRCATEQCPECQTVCNAPKCKTTCDAPKCTSLCAAPKCEWKCKDPTSCAKPKCNLKCDGAMTCPLGLSALNPAIPVDPNALTVETGEAKLGEIPAAAK